MWTVTLGQTSGLSTSDINQSLAVLDEALDYWGRYIDFGAADIEVKIEFIELDNTVLAQGGSTFRQNGGSLFQADSIIELQTGVDPNGGAEEIFIEVNTLQYEFDAFHLGGLNSPPPFDKTDLFTVLLHEIAHGFGFISLFDQPESTVFDSFVVGAPGSGFRFDGPITSSDFGLIDLTSPDPSHIQDSRSLLSEQLGPGDRQLITAREMWMMRDIGLPFLLPTEGNDRLYGLIGQPSISLLGGDDRYFSEGVGGAVFGGDGRDTITGGGNFHGEGGNDELFGGDSDDTLSGGGDNDLVSGNDGKDALFGGNGDDTLFGGIGSDLMTGGSGADEVYGNEGLDRLFGGSGNDTLRGGNNRDRLFGDEGDDQLFGGDDDDRVEGGSGADFVSGGSGNDVLIGGTENDQIDGEQGSDDLFGGDGDDALSGGLNNDRLQGGAGADTLDGGDGIDSAEYTTSAAPILLDLTAGTTAGGDATGDILISIERYLATPHNDTLIGGGLDDLFDGFSGNDSLEGRDGADTLFGGGGADTLLGGAGNDYLDAAGDGSRLEGGGGDDYLKIQGASNIIAHGGEGDDTIEAALGDVDGGADVDTLLYNFSSADIVQNAAPVAGIFSIGVLTFKNFEKITSSLFRTPTDIFYGSIGTDVIDVGSGRALLLAGAGNDTITGSAIDEDSGVTIIGAPDDGGGATESSKLINTGTGRDFIKLGLGDDHVSTRGGGDHIDLGAGDDTVIAGNGGDFIFGGEGNDFLHGGNDNDFFHHYDAGGFDTIVGGDGFDMLTLIFSNPVHITSSDEQFADTLTGGGANLISIENIEGIFSDSDDHIDFSALTANMRLVAGDGDDVVRGGSGDDRIFGRKGDDTLSGGGGVDRFEFFRDEITHNEVITDFDEFDILELGSSLSSQEIWIGRKQFSNTAGEIRFGFSGDWTVIEFDEDGNGVADFTLTLTNGHILLERDTSTTAIDISIQENIATSAADFLTGGRNADSLNGLGGNDTLSGLQGNDTLAGASGADSLRGDAGFDSLLGGSGGDTLIGGVGADTQAGGDGADSLAGQEGDDALFGGAGSDTIVGGDGADLMTGVAGNDQVFGGFGADTLFGGAQADTLSGGDDNDEVYGNQGADELFGGGGNDLVDGGDGDDLVTGQDGDDQLFGGIGNDTIFGGNGNDTLAGGNGFDSLAGNAGLDQLFGGNDADTIDGGIDADTVSGAGGDDFITGGTANDLLFGSAGNDTVAGGSGSDTLDGGADNDQLFGGADGDRLIGGAGDDTLSGVDGNDTFVGGAGDDLIFAGAGDDSFIFTAGVEGETIADFTVGVGSEDVITLNGFGAAFDAFSDVQAAASQVGNDVVIDLGGGDTITLLNRLVGDLHQDDFLFV